MEHDSIIINMKLTRNDGQGVRGNIIMILGIIMIALSVYDINEEYIAEQMLLEAAAAEQAAEEEGEQEPKEGEEKGVQEDEDKKKK